MLSQGTDMCGYDEIFTKYRKDSTSGAASSISEGDIFINSCSAQLISFEIDSISKESSCAEHEYGQYTVQS